MGSEWLEHDLSEFISIKHGYAFKGEFFKSEDTADYLLTPGNFSVGGGFKGHKFKFYAGPVPEDYILQKDDLVVTMTDLSKEADTLGYSALVPDIQGHRLLHNQRVGLVEFKDNEIDKTYLYFLLRSREYRHHVLSGVTGTTVKHTSPTKILSFRFRKPPKSVQIKIGRHLLEVERKIQLNRQINQTLEQMAQALFKSWFVDFDPVIDNALAAGNPIPPELEQKAAQRAQVRAAAKASQAKPGTHPHHHTSELPQHLRELFPSEFEHTEALGWVPKGWEIKSLKELSSKISKGTTPRKSDMAGATGAPEVKFLKVRDITDDGYILKDKLDLIPESISAGTLKRSILKTDDILVSIAGTIGRVTVIDEDLDGSNCNQAVAFVRLSDTDNMLPLAKLNLQSQRAQDEMSSKIVQAVQANFSLTDLGGINILVPDSEVLTRFNKSLNSYFKKKELSTNQSMSLTRLRDTLLPKLISGELRLPEAETDAPSLTDEASV